VTVDTALKVPLNALTALCRRYQVRELAVLGSALRDDFSAESDVDLLVEFQPEVAVGFLSLGRLQLELEALLGRRVDLVPKRGLKPLLRDEDLAGREILYAA
jgi:predicted nucleotidyltransferase